MAGEGEGLCIAKFKQSVVGAERTQTKLLPQAHLTWAPSCPVWDAGFFPGQPAARWGGGAARGQEDQGEHCLFRTFSPPTSRVASLPWGTAWSWPSSVYQEEPKGRLSRPTVGSLQPQPRANPASPDAGCPAFWPWPPSQQNGFLTPILPRIPLPAENSCTSTCSGPRP